jgi:hypothetical protein
MGRPSYEEMREEDNPLRQTLALESIATSLQQLVKVLNTKKK